MPATEGNRTYGWAVFLTATTGIAILILGWALWLRLSTPPPIEGIDVPVPGEKIDIDQREKRELPPEPPPEP